jgi:hypothetical protein
LASVTASVGLLFVAVVLEATHLLAFEELRWVLSALATAVAAAAAMAGNDEIGVVGFAFQFGGT